MRTMSVETQSAWWRPDLVTGPARARIAEAGPRSSTSSPIPFRLLLAFTFVLVISPQSLLPALAPFRIAFATALAAITACLGDRFVRGEALSIRRREISLVALLAAWAALTLPVSYWPGGSASFLFDIYLKSVAIFWLLCNTVDTETRLRQVLWALSLMSIPLAATAVWNYHTGAFVADASRGGVVRIEGYTAPLTTNPNDLALMLNLILPLSASLLRSARSFAPRALLAATIALSVVAVFLTFSRGGFLTLAATTLTGLASRMKGPVAIGIGAALIAGLLCLPLVPSAYVDHLRTITDIQSDATGSAQERWSDMLSAARYVALHPIFGAGIGMNTLALNEIRGTEWRMVHNVYLEYAADLGIPGLVLFVFLLFEALGSAARAGSAAAASAGMSETTFFAEGIRISLVGFVVAAMFHPVSYHFYFYYIAALAVAVNRIATARIGEAAA